MKKIKLSTKGFTLLETLLVLAVIVLVTAVTLLSINQAKTKARDARRIKELKQIEIALRLYSQSHDGNFPVCDNGEIVGNATGTLIAALVPRYLIAPPEDPLPNLYGYYYKTASLTITRPNGEVTIINGAFFRLAAYMETNKDVASNDGGTATEYYEIFSVPTSSTIYLDDAILDAVMPGRRP